MITVLFFARLREQVNHAHIELPATALRTVADIVKCLGDNYGQAMADALAASNIIVAVNHEVAGFATPVNSGDEVAFYPPVSGG
jgi:molybdopterin synthase sulfur carrier subunit